MGPASLSGQRCFDRRSHCSRPVRPWWHSCSLPMPYFISDRPLAQRCSEPSACYSQPPATSQSLHASTRSASGVITTSTLPGALRSCCWAASYASLRLGLRPAWVQLRSLPLLLESAHLV